MQDNIYIKIPQKNLYKTKKTKSQNPRKRKYMARHSMTSNQAKGERHYLCLLLNHIKGAISFTDLKIINGNEASSL